MNKQCMKHANKANKLKQKHKLERKRYRKLQQVKRQILNELIMTWPILVVLVFCITFISIVMYNYYTHIPK